MIEKSVKIKDEKGLHIEPAKDISQVAADYKSKIYMVSGDAIANAKSLLNILGAGIKCGAEVKLVCEGEDEAEAMEAVMKVLTEVDCID